MIAHMMRVFAKDLKVKVINDNLIEFSAYDGDHVRENELLNILLNKEELKDLIYMLSLAQREISIKTITNED